MDPPPGEGIQNRRRLAVATRHDLRPRLGQHVGVVAVLPAHQPLDDPEEALALGGLRLGGREPIRTRRRVIHQRGEQHRPARRQRPPRPPQMQRRRMPMTDRLLPHRRRIDGIQRQRHLDQLPPRRTHKPSLAQPRPESALPTPTTSRRLLSGTTGIEQRFPTSATNREHAAGMTESHRHENRARIPDPAGHGKTHPSHRNPTPDQRTPRVENLSDQSAESQ